MVVDIGYDPIRCSPSDHSPRFIKPGRTPVLSTINCLAESIGFEPMRRVSNDSLANCCLNHSANFPYMEEGVGFEPTDLLQPSVFKTGALSQAQPTLRITWYPR